MLVLIAILMIFICPYLHLLFFLNVLLFIASTKTRAVCTEDCPWLTRTNDDSYGCNDGSTCTAHTCCNERGGRAKCPLGSPLMCAQPNACASGSDYCCEINCDVYGGIRQCELISGTRHAYLRLSSKTTFDYTSACF